MNSQEGSAIAAGNIRGARIAIGQNGRIHVAWNGSVFSNKIDDAPTIVSLLNVPNRERGHFRPAQPTTEECCKHRAVPQPLLCVHIWRIQKRLRLEK